MKKTAIIKVSLASLVIGTGLFSNTAQASEISLVRHTLGLDKQTKHSQQVRQVAPESKVETSTLLNYYSQSAVELENVTGYTVGDNKLSFTPTNAGETLVTVSPYTFGKYKKENEGNPGLDVFVVKENTDRGSTDISIGGVTKTNSHTYKDPIKTPNISAKTMENGAILDKPLKGFSLKKEEVSLKELDFNLRKILIEQEGLYKGSYKSGTIKVHTNGNGLYTFELQKKLQDNRMSDVIRSSDIQNIEVTLTK